MSSDSPNVLPDLGSLHRHAIWESILLTIKLAERGVLPSNVPATLASGPPAVATAPEVQAAANDNMVVTDGIAQTIATPVLPAGPDEPAGSKNAKALNHITASLPTTLNHFFQGRTHNLGFFFHTSHTEHSAG
jgi:hypothetical protein